MGFGFSNRLEGQADRRDGQSDAAEELASLDKSIKKMLSNLNVANGEAENFFQKYSKLGINEMEMDNARAEVQNIEQKLTNAHLKKLSVLESLRMKLKADGKNPDKQIDKAKKESESYLKERQIKLGKILRDKYGISMQLESHQVISDYPDRSDVTVATLNNEQIDALRSEWSFIEAALKPE